MNKLFLVLFLISGAHNIACAETPILLQARSGHPVQISKEAAKKLPFIEADMRFSQNPTIKASGFSVQTLRDMVTLLEGKFPYNSDNKSSAGSVAELLQALHFFCHPHPIELLFKASLEARPYSRIALGTLEDAFHAILGGSNVQREIPIDLPTIFDFNQAVAVTKEDFPGKNITYSVQYLINSDLLPPIDANGTLELENVHSIDGLQYLPGKENVKKLVFSRSRFKKLRREHLEGFLNLNTLVIMPLQGCWLEEVEPGTIFTLEQDNVEFVYGDNPYYGSQSHFTQAFRPLVPVLKNIRGLHNQQQGVPPTLNYQPAPAVIHASTPALRPDA